MVTNNQDVVPDDVDDEWSVSRRRALMLASLGATAGLAGCTGGGGNSSGGTEDGGGGSTDGGGSDGGGDSSNKPIHFLTDYNNDAWQKKWEKDLIPKFTKETGNEVKIEYSGFSGNQENRLANLVQSGDPPALNTSTFEQVGDLWASGQLEDVGNQVAAAEDNSGSLISHPYHDGDSYWEMPHGSYVGTFIYREDVYEELGLEVPTSFQGVLENARIIDESDLDIRGYGLAGSKVGKAQDEFQTYLANMGAQEIRFKDREKQEEVEVWFPKKEIVTLLKYFKELSQYSPDPTSIGWGASLRNWVGGQFAQQYNLNVWPGGVAAGAGVDKIAKNTGVAPMPLWEEGGITKEDSWLSNPVVDGHHVFSKSDNPGGGKRFLEWLYADDANRGARMYETEPTRFLPAYGDVIGSEAFQNYSFWDDYPGLLEKLQHVSDTIVPEFYDNVEGTSVLSGHPIGVYYYRFFFQAEMVNQVITESATPEEAYEFGLKQAKKRVKEGREKMT